MRYHKVLFSLFEASSFPTMFSINVETKVAKIKMDPTRLEA